MNIEENLKRIIQAEADAVRAIDVQPTFAQAVELIQGTSGRVVATGIGKAGFIARKFAATLASTGTPAFSYTLQKQDTATLACSHPMTQSSPSQPAANPLKSFRC